MSKSFLAIVGGGDLAQAISKKIDDVYQVSIFDHNNFDITSPTQIDSLINQLITFDVIVITAGVYTGNPWNMWLVNTVGPCYLVDQLNQKAKNKQIIVVSSYGANWISWPGITNSRLTYNSSKLALSNFMLGLTQQGESNNRITVFEPSTFQSNMSNYTGTNIDLIAEQIKHVVDSPVHIMRLTVKK